MASSIALSTLYSKPSAALIQPYILGGNKSILSGSSKVLTLANISNTLQKVFTICLSLTFLARNFLKTETHDGKIHLAPFQNVSISSDAFRWHFSTGVITSTIELNNEKLKGSRVDRPLPESAIKTRKARLSGVLGTNRLAICTKLAIPSKIGYLRRFQLVQQDSTTCDIQEFIKLFLNGFCSVKVPKGHSKLSSVPFAQPFSEYLHAIHSIF
uniref:Uncharacterized protein n=1 Tax=Glossina palpalis gambiensis TaxID=67801 RepID=A0A1B0BSQ0_9MUSC